MPTDCVVVADAGRARFFTVQPPTAERFEDGPSLREHEDWTNPEGTMTGLELFENVKSGRKQSPGGGPAHGMDDHRQGHEREIARRFARRLARAIDEFIVKQHATRLILVAEPRMLGQLREPLAKQLSSQVRVDELAEDLSWHALTNIRKVLAQRDLLAPRSRSRAY